MTISVAEAFGAALKAARKKKGLSQEKLAFQSNLDRTYISLLERGKRQPSLSSILEISKCLDIPAHELIRITTDVMSDKNIDN